MKGRVIVKTTLKGKICNKCGEEIPALNEDELLALFPEEPPAPNVDEILSLFPEEPPILNREEISAFMPEEIFPPDWLETLLRGEGGEQENDKPKTTP